jgi:hypothetical protein
MPSSLADVEAEMTVEQWLAIRKEAALRIDPETAEVEWIYADIGDPYGVHNLTGGRPLRGAGILCPFTRKRHLGLL